MQPEGQNPAPSTNPNIPDYLGMEPIPDPSIKDRKNKTKKLIILVVVAVMVLGFALAFAYFLVEQAAMQRQEALYRALEKQMQVNYVKRTYTVASTQASDERGKVEVEATVNVDTDFSRVREPSSYVVRDYSLQQTEGEPDSYVTETVTLENGAYATMTETATANNILSGHELNKWYYAPSGATGKHAAIYYSLDDLESTRVLNSPLGLLLTGNYDESARKQLMDFIRKEKVYTVLDSQAVSDKKQTKYTVSIDAEALDELNVKALDLIKYAQYYKIQLSQADEQELSLTVDDATGKVVEMTYVEKKDEEKRTFKKTIMFEYPKELSLPFPDDIIGRPEQ